MKTHKNKGNKSYAAKQMCVYDPDISPMLLFFKKIRIINRPWYRKHLIIFIIIKAHFWHIYLNITKKSEKSEP